MKEFKLIQILLSCACTHVQTHLCVPLNILTYLAEKCKDHISSSVLLCNLEIIYILIFIMLSWSFRAQRHTCVWTKTNTREWTCEFYSYSKIHFQWSAVKCLGCTLLFISPDSQSKILFSSSRPPPASTTAVFPLFIHPFEHLKHQSITTQAVVCVFLLSVTHCLPFTESFFLLSCCPFAKLECVAKVSRLYMEDCFNVDSWRTAT